MNQQAKKLRGAAIRAQKRNQDNAVRAVSKHGSAQTMQVKPFPLAASTKTKLKLTFLGGLEDVGEKNMAVIEYQNEAIILDCGNNLGVDLPGINYEINDTAYLETIKHKIKAYVITHGHLDHIGGLRHTVPKFPAPIYGSRYTVSVIEKTFAEDSLLSGGNFVPDFVTADLESHASLRVGQFALEFIRITHSLPDAAALCITTPVGRIIATGDFRLDPEPLDHKPSDVTRLKELGDKGVLLLLSDSSYADVEGRVPTESTLQQSFHDIIGNAEGRIFVAAFSSNMNRAQMIINAAVAAGRKIALDGRGMMNYAEIAVRQGVLRIPKGVIVPVAEASSIPNDKILVMCTGGQGEPNAALQRMSEGNHKHVKLHQGDTVVISSSPIPGNEVSYDMLGNQLSKLGVHLFRHPTHELDGCGPLHVSGHARRGELREMIQLTRPKFFIPVHGGALRRKYHAELGIEEGIPRKHVALPSNGDSLYFTATSMESAGKVPHGSLLVDQNDTVVDGIVVKDRLMLSDQGILTVVITLHASSGQLLVHPDIISRGFIALKDNGQLLGTFRNELRTIIARRYKRTHIERFKQELRDYITHFMYEHTGRSPIIIPVVNIVSDKSLQTKHAIKEPAHFQELRAQLVGHDQRD